MREHVIFDLVEKLGEILDLFGVLVIVAGVILATLVFLKSWLHHTSLDEDYRRYRRNLGKVILLGLEFLVAGDIIRSVAGDPTFNGILILGMIVIIRTFLSFTFEMEISGRWPWQKKKD